MPYWYWEPSGYLPATTKSLPKGNGLYAGYTDTMKLTNVKCDKEDIGKIINVKITEAKTWSLNGEKE